MAHLYAAPSPFQDSDLLLPPSSSSSPLFLPENEDEISDMEHDDTDYSIVTKNKSRGRRISKDDDNQVAKKPKPRHQSPSVPARPGRSGNPGRISPLPEQQESNNGIVQAQDSASTSNNIVQKSVRDITSANMDYAYTKPTANMDYACIKPTADGLFVIIVQPVDKEKSFSKVNPLHTKRELVKLGSDIKISYLRFGGLVTKTKEFCTANKLLDIKFLSGLEVTTNTPRSEREIKGVITGIFFDLSNDDLVEDINSGDNPNNVTAIKAEKIGGPQSTARVVTFAGRELPGAVDVCLTRRNVKPFYDSPLQCYKCQRFSHTASQCKGKLRCLHCGADSHSHKDCEKKKKKLPPVCCNCLGNHAAWSAKCDARKVQIEINKYKVENKSSFAAARAVILPKKTSYAEALRIQRARKSQAQPSLPKSAPAQRSSALGSLPRDWPLLRRPARQATEEARSAQPRNCAEPSLSAPRSYAEAAISTPAPPPTRALDVQTFCNLVTMITNLGYENSTTDDSVDKLVRAARCLGVPLQAETAKGLILQFEESNMYE